MPPVGSIIAAEMPGDFKARVVYVSTFDGLATEAIWCSYHGYPKTLRKQLERHGIRKIEEVKP